MALTCRNTQYDDLPAISTADSIEKSSQPDILYCTRDMCPVKIHWHIKTNYKEYWRVKVTITNRDFSRNFTQWTLTLQHPNFDNFTEAFSFNYKGLNPYGIYSSKCHSNDLIVPIRFGHLMSWCTEGFLFFNLIHDVRKC